MAASDRARGWRIADAVEAHPLRFLAVYTIFYVFGFWATASHKPFWFDEIFTIRIADLPRIAQVWDTIRDGIELNPPLTFWVTWALHKVFGGGPVVSRLPAAAGYWTMSLCLFAFVQRRTNSACGLIALIFPLFTFASQYIDEARGYGLELGFAGVALICWQRALDGERRPWMLAGLSVGIAGALSSHYYAFYLPLCLVAAELLRASIRRAVDWGVAVALAAGVLPLVIYRPLLKAVAAGAQTFWAPAGTQVLFETYASIWTALLFVGVPLTAALALRDLLEDERERDGLAVWESAVAFLLACMPAAVFLAGRVAPAALWPKFVILAVPGSAILTSGLFYRMTMASLKMANLALQLAFWICFVPWLLWELYAVPVALSPETQVRAANAIPGRRDLKIVVTDDLTLMQDLVYFDPEVRPLLAGLTDLDAAARNMGYNTAQRSLAEGRKYWPIPTFDYPEFVVAHPKFILVRTGQTDWIAQKLIADGARLTLLEVRCEPGLSGRETQFYLVTTSGR